MTMGGIGRCRFFFDLFEIAMWIASMLFMFNHNDIILVVLV